MKNNITRNEAVSLLTDNKYKLIILDKVSETSDVYEMKGKPPILLKKGLSSFSKEWLNKQLK